MKVGKHLVIFLSDFDGSDLGVLLAIVTVNLGAGKRVLCEVVYCQLTFQVCYAGIQLDY